ncbi:hypothetical protein M9H77_11408 [Catharanthus roseus]|uniref:Uncharacterized protein n=1 Tax=Catharanthus roseus TaxID=4058 RepID=A0ACC0BEF3_CATRO|nr:hypothetical protein M9H77_11408 [Catharanthus roseus]
MDYSVLKTKFTEAEPPKLSPLPSPPPPPPYEPHEYHAHPPPSAGLGSYPFMGGGYTEELDHMSRIPGMINFQVTYTNTYRWNLMDPIDNCYGHQIAPSRGRHYWVPVLPPPLPLLRRRPLGPLPEYGPYHGGYRRRYCLEGRGGGGYQP